jgi:ABC-type transporter Mla subunit MlaD
VATLQPVVEGLGDLSQELRRWLEVLVLDQRDVLDAAARQAELAALLALVAELGEQAEAALRGLVRQLHQSRTEARPDRLRFGEAVARVPADLRPVLEGARQALLAWACQSAEGAGLEQCPDPGRAPRRLAGGRAGAAGRLG